MRHGRPFSSFQSTVGEWFEAHGHAVPLGSLLGISNPKPHMVEVDEPTTFRLQKLQETIAIASYFRTVQYMAYLSTFIGVGSLEKCNPLASVIRATLIITYHAFAHVSPRFPYPPPDSTKVNLRLSHAY